MSHTEGLLAVNHDRIESKDEHGWANDGWIIAQCMGPDAVANTSRLVACWNACDGLPQDALDGGWTAAGISQYAKRLEGERDALKAENERLRKDGEQSTAVHKIISVTPLYAHPDNNAQPSAQDHSVDANKMVSGQEEPVAWPPECEELCQAAERMQRAINELWKAEYPEELDEDQEYMDIDKARELHTGAWNSLHAAIHYMRKRISAPPAQEVKSVLIVGMGWNEKYQIDQQPVPSSDGTLVCFVKESQAQKELKVEFTKDWCMKMAQLEGDQAIGAGAPAQDDDHTCTSNPVVAHETGNVDDKQDDEPVALIKVMNSFGLDVYEAELTDAGVNLPEGTKLYTRPDNSELRKAAEALIWAYDNHEHCITEIGDLRAALEGN